VAVTLVLVLVPRLVFARAATDHKWQWAVAERTLFANGPRKAASMRGSRLPQGTLHLLRQRQWDCCDRSCSDLAFGSILGNADFSIKERPVESSLDSKVNGETVDGCSQVGQVYAQKPEHHSRLLAFQCDPQSRRSMPEREGLKSGRRWYSSDAGDADQPPGRGRGLGFLGGFTGNGIGRSSQAGTEQDAVSVNAAEGQFEDNENEKREKPGTLLQQILAAASKEQAAAARQAGEQPINGRSTAVGEPELPSRQIFLPSLLQCGAFL
jgi:hypothetical protein